MIISWGIPTIKAVRQGSSPITVNFPTPVDGSTSLSSEKGDKMEALVEGGEPEAVKYKRGKYTLEFQIRIGKDRLPNSDKMIDGNDGVVSGEWKVTLTAEDSGEGAPGFTIPRCVCSYTDTYSSSDGIIRTYTFDSLKPETGNQILWDADSSN